MSADNPLAEQKAAGLGLPLLVIATAQLMLVLDDSVANIALPTIQNQLGIATGDLPWVINAYILAFGGLLLFGGRLGDIYGRRRLLQIGMAIFTVASLFVGLAQDGLSLIAFRGLQGFGAALTAPNALALIATTFPEGKPRNRALAIYGAMSGLGIVAGLLLGGIITDVLGWRWVFFINIPVGLLVLLGSSRLVEAELHRGRVDLVGAVTSIGGMTALLYGITRGAEHGWSDALTLGSFAAAAFLLPLFIGSQWRSRDPLLPPRLFQDRNRVGSYLGVLFFAVGPMGAFYLLTLYMQHIAGYSPLLTGLAWLPFAAGIVIGAGVSSKLVLRLSPRQIAVPGAIIAAGGAAWLSLISEQANYFAHILPGIFAIALGFAFGLVSLTLTAVKGVQDQDTGIASALLNASQQVGVAFGLAVLSTVSVSVTAARMPDALRMLYRSRSINDTIRATFAGEALIHGYSIALAVGAIALATAAVIIAILVTARKDELTAPDGMVIG